MRRITLSAIQCPDEREGASLSERKAGNIRIALSLMEEAVREGADLVCLPETFQVRGGRADSKEATFQSADQEGGELALRLGDFARSNEVNVIAPVLGRYGATLRNVAWVFSRQGELVGRYFKVHCTQSEREQGIVPGDEWPVFELDCGSVGVMICHDNSWPESARCLALNGAEIICWPHVQSGWGDVAWDITLRSRAIDNAVYILSACYGVPEGKAWRPGMMMGRSGTVGPDGAVLADGGRKPGVVSMAVDLDQVLLKHDFTRRGDHGFLADMLADRRPETYAPLTRTP